MSRRKLIPDPPGTVKPKPKRKKAATRGTITIQGGVKGREDTWGNEERLAVYIKRTMELKRKGYYLHEIAEMIATEYNLEKLPHITTIAKWRQAGMDAINEDIIALQTQIRIDQFNDLESLKSKWMAIATAEHLEVTRWKMVEGCLQPELDENAVKEQIEATKQVVAIMARQAKLMGLDLDSAKGKNGEGPEDLQALQLWIVGHVSGSAQPSGQPIDIQAEVLSLASGIPECDSV